MGHMAVRHEIAVVPDHRLPSTSRRAAMYSYVLTDAHPFAYPNFRVLVLVRKILGRPANGGKLRDRGISANGCSAFDNDVRSQFALISYFNIFSYDGIRPNGYVSPDPSARVHNRSRMNHVLSLNLSLMMASNFLTLSKISGSRLNKDWARRNTLCGIAGTEPAITDPDGTFR